MNILIINDHGLFGGGTETRIRLFVEELLKQKAVEEIHILQKFPSRTDENKQEGKSLFFHTITQESAYAGYSITKKIIKEHNISLVQAHNLLAINPYALLAAKRAGIPIMWWVHDYWLLCAKRSFIDPYNASKEELCDKAAKRDCSRCMGLKTRIKYAFWKRIMNYTVDHAIAPAKILQEIHEYNNILQGKWSVIVPWIDSDFFHVDVQKIKKQNKHTNKQEKNKEENKDAILFVGSLIEFKGAWVAAKAMKKICAAYSHAKLLFVGGEQEKEGRYRKQVEEICKQDGTSNAVVFLGKKTKEEIHELQRNAAVYICPTVCMESFGLNWAEAMAAGIPVVASAIGSITEYIQDGKTGILFPARNHDALADAILELLSNERYALQVGRNGQIYAREHFALQRAAKEILHLYQSLLEKKDKNGKK